MIELLNYFKARYLGEKGQGIVEYALILAFAVVLAGYLTNSDTGLGTAIKSTIANVSAKLTATT